MNPLAQSWLQIADEVDAINIKFGSNYKLARPNNGHRARLLWGNKFQTSQYTKQEMWIFLQGIRLGKFTARIAG